MTPNKSLFNSFSDDHSGTVILGNNKTCDIKGIGSIVIKNHEEKLKELQEVRYVPDLKRNLLSIGMFDKRGYSVKINDGDMKICKGSQVVIKGKLNNGLYILDGKSVAGSDAPAIENTKMSNIRLWHLRLSVKGG